MLTGWQFAQQRGLPFVATPFAHLGSGHDRVALNSTMDHQKRLLREAAAVLTLTDIERTGLANYGIEPARLTTIGGGLDPLPDLVSTAGVMARLAIKRPFLLFVGRHNQEKGAFHAVQAVNQLRQQGEPLELLLIGQRTAEFDRFYSQLSPSHQAGIRPLGLLNDSDKHALLSQAEMLLLPSRSDSFGIVLLEAWAHRKPVIGARSGGIPGVIDAAENGLLVEFGDVDGLARTIAQLHHNPAQRQQLGTHGWHKTQTVYNWTAVTDKVLAVYQQVTARLESSG
jgi:glycosyltransferase involved in cell wall biosynthesis